MIMKAAIITAIATIIAALIGTWAWNESPLDNFGGDVNTTNIGGNINAPVNTGSGDLNINKYQYTNPEAELSGILMPANESDHTPDKPACVNPRDNKRPPEDALKIYLGPNLYWTTDKNTTHNILRILDHDLLSIRLTSKGAFISGKIFSDDGREVVIITDNEFDIDPNSYFMRPLRPDPHEIRFIDKDNLVRFRIRYLNDVTFDVEGIFQVPDEKSKIIIGNDKLSVDGAILSGGCFYRTNGGTRNTMLNIQRETE